MNQSMQAEQALDSREEYRAASILILAFSMKPILDLWTPEL